MNIRNLFQMVSVFTVFTHMIIAQIVGSSSNVQQPKLSSNNQFTVNPSNKLLNSFKRIPNIEIYGGKFFYSNNGSEFFIRGIAYQPDYNMYQLPSGWDHLTRSYIDPLAFPEICSRDINNLRKLNVNTIRVYAIDPKLDHDYCMNLMAENGIYVLADLSEPQNSIVREMPTWDVDLYERYTDVVNCMQKYDNLLGFFAGNEVVTDETNIKSAPFVRASVRDTKLYIKEKKFRTIPVGYSTNDDAKTRNYLREYFVCENEDTMLSNDSMIDFYGINNYEWCGHSTFRTSGYSERLLDYQGFPIPVFFSEFGCNTVRPRPFTEVDALFSPLMAEVFSGGIMYMYFEEANNYGIVAVEDFQNISSAVTLLDEFKFLQYQFSKVDPQGVNRKYYKPDQSLQRECPKNHKAIQVSTVLPNKPDLFRCGCVMSTLSCVKSPNVQMTVEDVKEVYSQICRGDQNVTCTKLVGDGKLGQYGIFSSCRKSQRLSILMNDYFLRHGSDSNYCKFGNKATMINTQNSISDLHGINDPNNDKNYTCYQAIGNEQIVNSLYGISPNGNNSAADNPFFEKYHRSTLNPSSKGSVLKLSFTTILTAVSLFGSII